MFLLKIHSYQETDIKYAYVIKKSVANHPLSKYQGMFTHPCYWFTFQVITIIKIIQ